MNLFFRLFLTWVRGLHMTPLSTLDTTWTNHRVLLFDLDTNGHMNNGRYLSIMDLGRLALIMRLGLLNYVVFKGWRPVVGSLHIVYKKSLKWRQKYQVKTDVLGWDDTWVYIKQTFVRQDVVYAKAIVKGLFVDKNGKIPSQTLVETSSLIESTRVNPDVATLHDVVDAWLLSDLND